MSQNFILEIKNLKKTYDYDLFKKPQTILSGLSCGFLEGQCTALMGHNGAGKTTTIRTIFGLIKPDAGEVLFKGRPLSRKDKAHIGYMPETNKLPINLTCEEILLHQLRVFRPQALKSRHYRDAVSEKLKEIGLWDHRQKRVGKLSKGMGRRLSWAQATIHRPDLIILDEPMSGLDPLGQKLMVSLISKLREENVSIILCSHELYFIQDLCDQAHILNHGKLVFSTLEEKDAESAPKPRHRLVLSGCDLSSLETLRDSSRLPEWTSVQVRALRIELNFQQYADAMKWLQASLLKGFLVVDFKKSSQFDEDFLIQYFGEERSA